MNQNQTEPPKFDISLYNDEFFEWHLKHVHKSSVRCMEWYCEQYEPKSVLDLGCGIGSYLLGALNKGLSINHVYGIEISGHAEKYTDERIKPSIVYESVIGRRSANWKCVICFEVAEHIEPIDSDDLIQGIAHASNGRILFSAAPPGQDGTGHINCQPKEYWIDLFAKCGRTPLESITEHIAANWKRLGAPDYIVKNLIVL